MLLLCDIILSIGRCRCDILIVLMEVDATHLEWTACVGRHHHGSDWLIGFGCGGSSDDAVVVMDPSRIAL